VFRQDLQNCPDAFAAVWSGAFGHIGIRQSLGKLHKAEASKGFYAAGQANDAVPRSYRDLSSTLAAAALAAGVAAEAEPPRHQSGCTSNRQGLPPQPSVGAAASLPEWNSADKPTQ
jgi:hypothetical protein